jgi:hypothetical protein
LPDDLDFFVVLSSMSGIIGNAARMTPHPSLALTH